ncbi:unnamed protein product [Pleuronectes platessa]|uniref:Uncharacterized protein n=1 Tax=Pleuronectes platessa TaxID=8262 RepID=A0A9N7V609_PLEPL|nr:unnamed protein product [Pleuronectes platessa]
MSSPLVTVERKISVNNWKKPPAEAESVWETPASTGWDTESCSPALWLENSLSSCSLCDALYDLHSCAEDTQEAGPSGHHRRFPLSAGAVAMATTYEAVEVNHGLDRRLTLLRPESES